MERDRRGHRTLTPSEWMWFWRISMVTMGPALVVIGLTASPVDVRLIGLAVVIEVVGVLMLGFWRQVQFNREDRAAQPPPESS